MHQVGICDLRHAWGAGGQGKHKEVRSHLSAVCTLLPTYCAWATAEWQLHRCLDSSVGDVHSLSAAAERRFRRNFVNTPWVRVPIVHWQSTTASIITLEYLPGIKITDIGSMTAAGA